MKHVAWCLVLALAACSNVKKSDGKGGSASAGSAGGAAAIAIAGPGDLAGAVGKLVRVRGTVAREKLGDTVDVGGTRVRCLDARFPDAAIGAAGTAEGTLGTQAPPQASVNAKGEISQGVEGDEVDEYVLRGCRLP